MPPPKTTFSFESLPCEIILAILPRITDPATLCSLLDVSPVARRAFNQHDAPAIVEGVLTAGYTCVQVQSLFRFCALFRSHRLPQWTHRELVRHVFNEPLYARSHPGAVQDPYEPQPLAQDLDLEIIHQLLRVARDISNAALECLADSLSRFQKLEPRRPVDDGFAFDGTKKDVDALSQDMEALAVDAEKLRNQAWDCQPETTKVPTKDIGACTWTEEQGAMRAFWRLQLAYEADYIALIRELPVGEMRDLWWHEAGLAIHRTVHPSHPPRETEAWCYDLERTALHSPEMHLPNSTTEKSPAPEYYEIVAAVDYLEDKFGQDLADDIATNQESLTDYLDDQDPGSLTEEMVAFDPERRCPSVSRRWPMPMPADGDEERLQGPSACSTRLFKSSLQSSHSPLSSVGFAPFSRYGFAFWCDERMQGYGLAETTDAGVGTTLQDGVDYTWLSLLSADETAAVKKQPDEVERTRLKIARPYFPSSGV